MGVAYRRRFGNQLLVGKHALGGRAIAHVDQDRADLGGGGDVVGEVQEMVIDQQDTGVAVVQRVDDLRHAPADIHWVENSSAPPAGEHVFQKAVGVQGQHAHPVAIAHAVLLQRSGQARDPFSQFMKAAASAAEDSGGLIGVKLQGTVQPLGQVHQGDPRNVLVVDTCVDRCESAWLSYENIFRTINWFVVDRFGLWTRRESPT
ncbi:hypothetical protein D9M68_283530 [compost metagenome]